MLLNVRLRFGEGGGGSVTHLYCLVGCLSMIGHMLFWVSYMRVFCIFVFAPV